MEFSIDGFDPQHFGFQDPDTDPIINYQHVKNV